MILMKLIDQEDYNVENPDEVNLDVDENDDSDVSLAIKRNLFLEKQEFVSKIVALH